MKPKKNQPPPRKKVGKNLYVLDTEGKIVEGLAYDKGNGYYFYSAWRQEEDVKQNKKTRKDYQFGRNYDEAIFKFRQWEKKKYQSFIDVGYDSIQEEGVSVASPDEVPDGAVVEHEFNEDGYLGSTAVTRQISEAELWAKARALILHDIRTASKKLNLPALIEIEDKLLQYKPIPPLSLSAISSFYRKYNSCTKKEKGQVELATNDLIKHSKQDDIEQTDKYDVISFDRYLQDGKHSTNFINKRIGRLVACLNFYNKNYEKHTLKDNLHEKEIDRVIGLVQKHTTKVDDIIKDPPKSIDVQTLTRLFKRAIKARDNEMLLMLLLMINTGYYPVDIRTLQKDRIKTKGDITYILYSRKKTGQQFVRVNVLWNITAQLLKKHLKKRPNSSYVFTNARGFHYTVNTLGKRFKKFLDTPTPITYTDNSLFSPKHFRDTVSTELAFDVKNVNIMKVTIGHSIKGSSDAFWRYIDSKPEQQKPAADILYRKFNKAIEIVNDYHLQHLSLK